MRYQLRSKNNRDNIVMLDEKQYLKQFSLLNKQFKDENNLLDKIKILIQLFKMPIDNKDMLYNSQFLTLNYIPVIKEEYQSVIKKVKGKIENEKPKHTRNTRYNNIKMLNYDKLLTEYKRLLDFETEMKEL